MGWLFPLLVWNRPSSSSCRKGPAHLENSKIRLVKKLNIIVHLLLLLLLLLLFFFFLYLEIQLNIVSLNNTISQVPQPRKRLILRGSCPHSRLGHTSDIHSHSYSNDGFSHPEANITHISCWNGLHLQFFLCVSVFSDN